MFLFCLFFKNDLSSICRTAFWWTSLASRRFPPLKCTCQLHFDWNCLIFITYFLMYCRWTQVHVIGDYYCNILVFKFHSKIIISSDARKLFKVLIFQYCFCDLWGALSVSADWMFELNVDLLVYQSSSVSFLSAGGEITKMYWNTLAQGWAQYGPVVPSESLHFLIYSSSNCIYIP